MHILYEDLFCVCVCVYALCESDCVSMCLCVRVCVWLSATCMEVLWAKLPLHAEPPACLIRTSLRVETFYDKARGCGGSSSCVLVEAFAGLTGIQTP